MRRQLSHRRVSRDMKIMSEAEVQLITFNNVKFGEVTVNAPDSFKSLILGGLFNGKQMGEAGGVPFRFLPGFLRIT